MRTRKEIKEEWADTRFGTVKETLRMEVLLDIRDLLDKRV